LEFGLSPKPSPAGLAARSGQAGCR
jgi:hypothetical protein